MVVEYKEEEFYLKDGRRLGFITIGKSEGDKVIYYHGWPGTRNEILPFDNIAEKSGFQIIGIDRPGCGLSSYQKKRKVSDFVNDLKELLDFLNIQNIHLLGFSTGGIYALETALQLNNRVKSITLVSAVPYFKIKLDSNQMNINLKIIYLLGRIGIFSKPFLRISSDSGLLEYKINKEKAYKKSLEQKAPLDQEILIKPEMVSWAIDDFIPDLLKSSRRGLAHDLYLLVQSVVKAQSNQLAKKITKPIYFWHGLLDEVVPSFTSVEQKKLFKNSELQLLENEGHSMIYRNIEAILNRI